MKNGNRVFDVFSGIGGFSLALKKAGFNVIGAYEKDKNAYQIYKENFPNVDVICESPELVNVEGIPEFDFLPRITFQCDNTWQRKINKIESWLNLADTN